MGYAELTDAQQKFLKKYLKAERKAKGALSDETRDDMADKVADWDALKAKAQRFIDNLPKDLGRKDFHKRIKAADKVFKGDGKALDEANGRPAMQSALDDAKQAAKTFGDGQIATAEADMVKIRGYFGADKALVDLDKRRQDMDAAMAKDLPDLEKVRASRAVIANAEQRLKAWHEKLTQDYAALEKDLKSYEDNSIPLYQGTPAAKFVAPMQSEIVKVRAKMLEGAPVSGLKEASAALAKLNGDALSLVMDAKSYPRREDGLKKQVAKLPTDRACIAQDLAEVQNKLATADAHAKNDEYTQARLLVGEGENLLAEMSRRLAAEDAYLLKAGPVRTRVAGLKDNPGAGFAPLEVADAEKTLAEAEALAQAGDYTSAEAKLAEADRHCAAAEPLADRSGDFADLALGSGEGDLSSDIATAAGLLKKLEGHPAQDIASTQIKTAQDRLKAAGDAGGPGKAEQAAADLRAAKDAIAEGWLVAEVHGRLRDKLAALERELADLRAKHVQGAYVAPRLSPSDAAVAQARTRIDKAHASAAKSLREAGDLIGAASALADREAAYRGERQTVAALIAQAKQAKLPDIAKRRTELDKRMADADAASAAFDHDGADKRLAEARSLAEATLLGAKVRGKTAPDPAELKALLDQPGGGAAVDEMIAGLRPKDVRMDAMVALLSARFNMKVEVFKGFEKPSKDAEGKEGTKQRTDAAMAKKKAPNLLLYYKAMAELPDAHTRFNDSLKEFQQIEKNDASDYSGVKKRVRMVCHGAATSKGNALGDKEALPEIDKKCRVIPDSEVPTPNYGSWTTLHEIGHAVDDKKSFMNKNGKGADFGGWSNHGANAYPVAEAAARHFEFDHVYIEAKITGGSPEIPDVPFDLEERLGEDRAEKEWKARRKSVDEWAAAVGLAAELWESGAGSVKHALDVGGAKRVFHEAYKGSWVSYDLAARKRGVSGYQFRAPGEWFSELYAAYHAGKLRKSHPSYDWLEAL